MESDFQNKVFKIRQCVLILLFRSQKRPCHMIIIRLFEEHKDINDIFNIPHDV